MTGPLFTSATTDEASVTLTWQDRDSAESGFVLTRTGASSLTKTLPANATSYVDTAVEPARKYTYALVAVDSAGRSFGSTQAEVVTLKPPKSLNARATSPTSASVWWDPDGSTNTGFTVERQEVGVNSSYEVAGNVASATPSFIDSGLTAGGTYRYRVRAESAAGPSAYSAPATVVLRGDGPVAPSQLTAQPSAPTYIALAWKDNSNNEVGFEIERRKTSGGSFERLTTVNADTTEFQDTQTDASTSYEYRVRSVNFFATSAYSNVASARTGTGFFEKYEIDSLPASSPTGNYQLRWKSIGTISSTSFVIEESPDLTFSTTARYFTSGGVKTYTFTNKPSGTYCYRVRGSAPGWSEAACIVVRTPSNVVVLATADNTVQSVTGTNQRNLVLANAPLLAGLTFVPGPFISVLGLSAAAIRFDDIKSYVGSRTVKRAVLRLYATDAAFNPTGNIVVSAIATPWSTATLNFDAFLRLRLYIPGRREVPHPSRTGAFEVDVTAIVKNWVSGATANQGLALVDTSASAPSHLVFGTTTFASREAGAASPAQRPNILIEFE